LSCYANVYDEGSKETRPFGPKRYNYTSGRESGSSAIWGYAGEWYEGGGYIVDIPLGSNFTDELQELINDRWYDQATRAIIITVPTLNLNLDARIAVSYLLFEFPAGGAVTPSVITKIFRISLYRSPLDYFRGFLEAVFVIFLGYWIYSEFHEFNKIRNKFVKSKIGLRRQGALPYFTSMWNIMEIVNLLALIVVSIMYIVFLASSERSLKLDTREYLPKLEDLASKATLYYNIAAFNILICAFRTLNISG
jgi:hypothetical protein